MGAIEISILACLQGITEFLPVSSSGHLRAAAEIRARVAGGAAEKAVL